MRENTFEVDWAEELGIDMVALSMEAFWHPVAQWENARIAKQGEDYWAWRRLQNPEPPIPLDRFEAKPRPMFDFTEKQIAMGLRLLGAKE
jgi:hypothetical protein